jgi:hypothetical protein
LAIGALDGVLWREHYGVELPERPDLVALVPVPNTAVCGDTVFFIENPVYRNRLVVTCRSPAGPEPESGFHLEANKGEATIVLPRRRLRDASTYRWSLEYFNGFAWTYLRGGYLRTLPRAQQIAWERMREIATAHERRNFMVELALWNELLREVWPGVVQPEDVNAPTAGDACMWALKGLRAGYELTGEDPEVEQSDAFLDAYNWCVSVLKKQGER